MQGLLDFIKTPEGQGLLSGVFGYAANARRGTPINNLGRGGVAGLLGYSNALDREQDAKQNSWLQEYRGLQMDQMRSEIEKNRQAEAERQRIDGLVRGAIGGFTPQQAIGMDASGPTQAKANMIGQPGQVDYRALYAQGVPMAKIQELVDLGNVNKTKVKNIETINIDGKPVKVGIDEYGQQVAQIGMEWKPLERVDAGGYVGLYDPTNPQGGVRKLVDKTLSPEGRDASARGWASVALDREKFAADRSKEAKPQFNADVGGFVYPPDMRNPQGRIVKVDGATKPPNEGQGKAVLFGSRMSESNRILNELEEKGVTPSWSLSAAEGLPLIGNVARAAVNMGPMVSKEEQMYDQAQRDFINAILRRESGAVISPEEFANAARQYFPSAGDSETVKAQKRRNREIALQGLTYEAGPHSAAITRNNPPAVGGRSSGLPPDIQNLLNKY